MKQGLLICGAVLVVSGVAGASGGLIQDDPTIIVPLLSFPGQLYPHLFPPMPTYDSVEDVFNSMVVAGNDSGDSLNVENAISRLFGNLDDSGPSDDVLRARLQRVLQPPHVDDYTLTGK